jgi:hypothetical protein
LESKVSAVVAEETPSAAVDSATSSMHSLVVAVSVSKQDHLVDKT